MDKLEKQLGDQILIIRVNVQGPAGQELARTYGFEYTPTFIFLDRHGNELWRQVGGLDTERVRQSLQ